MMSNSHHDDQNPQEPGSGAPPELVGEAEAEAMFATYTRAESRRWRRAAAVGLALLLALMTMMWLLVEHREALFRPKLPIAQGEQEVLSATNDPVCRGMIADITAVGKDYFVLEGRLEIELLEEDPQTITGLIAEIEALIQRLAAAQMQFGEANLRYEDSSKELEEWFEFVNAELAVLKRIASEHLEATSTLGADLAAPVEEVPQSPKGHLVKAGKGAALPATPEEQAKKREEVRSRALLAVHDSFQNFRVWHSAGFHPCGAAAEGVTPWRPAKVDSQAH